MLGRARFIQLILFTPFASLWSASTTQMPRRDNQGSVPETLVPLIFQRQLQTNSCIRQYSVTVETHIRILKSAPYLFVLRRKQYHYVDGSPFRESMNSRKPQKATGQEISYGI